MEARVGEVVVGIGVGRGGELGEVGGLGEGRRRGGVEVVFGDGGVAGGVGSWVDGVVVVERVGGIVGSVLVGSRG